jgi:hypothetical protein
VYEREYGGVTFTLEASGGLLNSSLVMQDRETDSYWSIMSGEIIAGRLSGTKIIELPVGEKIKWKHWVQKHPETKVLSVNGREDTYPAYDEYYASAAGFRNQETVDTRFKTKEPVFTFAYSGKKYAVPFSAIENGATFVLNDATIFLYRPENTQIFQSTVAYITTGSGFIKEGRKWKDIDSGCVFNTALKSLQFEGNDCPQKMNGFDTFWYHWSLNNPETEVLGRTE